MKNETDETIRVLSGTKESIVTTIEAQQTRDVSHVLGPIEIVRDGKETWHYNDIHVLIITAQSPRFKDVRGIIYHHVYLHLVLKSDGRIYAVPIHGVYQQNYTDSQPPGFPLTPNL
jgi:hypothetical protein